MPVGIPAQLSLFSPERLPRRPYCTDDYQAGNYVRGVDAAVQKRYIQPNPPAVRFRLVFDVDRPAGAFAWQDSGVAPPNWTATNPANGHAHVCYEIDIPIVVDPSGRAAPVRFAAAIECGYRALLNADASYSGHLVKNPLHAHWITDAWREHGYSLHELCEYVPDINRFADRRRKIPEVGLGRNVSLFNQLRHWAYKAVNTYRPAGDFEAWLEAVADKAGGYNNAFDAPMHWGEVKHTVKSVAKWVWRIAPASALAFSRVQSDRGARRHEAFKEEHGVVAYEKAQADIARIGAAVKRERTRQRIIEAIGQITARGERVSMGAVARLIGISQQAISKSHRDLFGGTT